MTQSGASQLVHHLEEHLGVKLIDRSKRPFVLTPEGEVYYAGCRSLVQQLYALEEQVRSLHHEVEGRVSVASIYSVGLSHMNRCVQDFLSQYPKANVRVEYQHPQRVMELVDSGQVDMGLVSYPKQTRTLKAIAWREEPMVMVCAPSHALAVEAALSWSNWTDLRWSALMTICGFGAKSTRSCWHTRCMCNLSWNLTTSRRSSERWRSMWVSVCCPSRPSNARVQSGSLVAIPAVRCRDGSAVGHPSSMWRGLGCDDPSFHSVSAGPSDCELASEESAYVTVRWRIPRQSRGSRSGSREATG